MQLIIFPTTSYLPSLHVKRTQQPLLNNKKTWLKCVLFYSESQSWINAFQVLLVGFGLLKLDTNFVNPCSSVWRVRIHVCGVCWNVSDVLGNRLSLEGEIRDSLKRREVWSMHIHTPIHKHKFVLLSLRLTLTLPSVAKRKHTHTSTHARTKYIRHFIIGWFMLKNIKISPLVLCLSPPLLIVCSKKNGSLQWNMKVNTVAVRSLHTHTDMNAMAIMDVQWFLWTVCAQLLFILGFPKSTKVQNYTCTVKYLPTALLLFR